MNYKLTLENQLCLDYNCSLNEVQSTNNIFTYGKLLNGRRIFRSDNSVLKICCVNGKLIFSCSDQNLLDWCKETYKSTPSAWFSEYPNLKKLDTKLQTMGHTIADFHHFYLPTGHSKIETNPCKIVWYNQEQIFQFQGDDRFCEALSFIEQSPDILAVVGYSGDTILGMAGASADCANMYQIGINVTPEGKHIGMGTYLTSLLKNAILDMDKVAFYGTVESHIQSQRVAIQSGFIPAWAETYTQPIE